jgi:16S rRNA (cytidine1402-2'-O)-methyltransferase
MITRQKSFATESGKLFLVATPIGNLDDMSFRAVKTLQEASVIYAEDTRVTKVLLSHFHITTPLRSHHAYNEDARCEEILAILLESKHVAIVSDAGMPGISDPGYLIAKEAIKEGFDVVCIPGPTAVVTAITVSGLPIEPYLYAGFLNTRSSKKEKELFLLKDRPETLCFYESVHRLVPTLSSMLKILGNRNIALCRELTKKHEEIIRGTIDDILPIAGDLKGEFVIVVEGASKTDPKETSLMTLSEHIDHYRKQGFDEKEVLKKIASDKNVSKSDVYKEVLIWKGKKE